MAITQANLEVRLTKQSFVRLFNQTLGSLVFILIRQTQLCIAFLYHFIRTR